MCFKTKKTRNCVFLFSRHHGVHLRILSSPLDHRSTIVLSGLSGTLNWASIMPIGVSLSMQQTLEHHSNIAPRGLGEALNWACIMPIH